MAFKQDAWMTLYNDCESLAREIMEKISYRNQQPKNSVASTKASAQARTLMKKYNDSIANLKQTLMAVKDILWIEEIRHLTQNEVDRRLRLIDGLNNKNAQIIDAFSGREEGGTRQALLGAETPSKDVWGMEEDERTRDLSFNEIREQQQMAIQEQDKGLDTLYDVVVRQVHMSANIGQELDLQNEMIDDIMDHADNTKERLIKETRHVAIVDRKSGECCYWVIIMLLFVAIIVVAAVPS